VISRGRLTLGIGAGYLETEYRQYGWEFPARPAVRIRQMEEAVRLILAMWTEKRTTLHGKYFHVEDAILEPKPWFPPQLTRRVDAAPDGDDWQHEIKI
jgi:alkanesulfonate monooxygenase SsuD/methylene tetrahydromethanopterin reductase-like flavin-dependent oxidoreductase (luciferase family)